MGMGMKATSGGGESYEIPEAGPQLGVLVALIDCGTHPKSFGGEPKSTHELYLAWELPEQRMSGTNRNHVISRTFTFSFHEKSGFRKLVEAWVGRKFKDDEEFDPKALLGKPCQVNVAHKETSSGKTVANVDGVMRLMKGTPPPKATLPALYYELEPGKEPPKEDWLPFLWNGSRMVHVSSYVADADEWAGEPAMAGGGDEPEQDDQDVPF